MTYVFRHKTEENRIKMIDAGNMVEAKEKLSKRLLEHPTIINGVRTFESIKDYQYDCVI